MAIKVNGTTVIDDSRVLSGVTGLKTVGGTSILGSGNIEAGASTAVNGVGTYLMAQDTSMAEGNSSRNAVIYKEGRTVAASNLKPVGMAWVTGVNYNTWGAPSPVATSTSGTNVATNIQGPQDGSGGYSMSNGIGSNQSYSGSWRMMTPSSGPSTTSTGLQYNWWNLFAALWVRYA
jgi:hypothetical protein